MSIVQVPSPHFRKWGKARRVGDVWHVVIHCDHGAHVVPVPGAAERLARSMAEARPSMLKPYPPSYHYIVDNGGAVQCLAEHQIGRAVRDGNEHAIHVCIIGRAPDRGRLYTDWFGDDRARPAVLCAAELAYEICERWIVPWVHVDFEALRGGYRGITTHAAFSRADGPGGNDHGDPAGLHDDLWDWPAFLGMGGPRPCPA